MEDDVTEKIAGNVRAAMAYREISGKQAAAHLGIKHSQFSRRYSGDVPWKAHEIDSMARLVNFSVSALVRGDGLREPEAPAVQPAEEVVPPGTDEAAERRRELLSDRADELLEVCRRLAGDLDRTRVALELIQRELREL